MSLVDGGKNHVGATRCRISAGLQRKENTHNKAVKCIELNKIYQSAAVASAELNILRTSITNCLHKRSNTAGGYHWEFFKEEN